MLSTSDIQKWQTAINGINESGQQDLSQEEWSALTTLNGSLQTGNFQSDESRQALALLKNNLSRHNNNRILQAHLRNFITLCEQYITSAPTNRTVRSSGATTNKEKSKGGINKILVLVIVIMIVGFWAYAHWNNEKETTKINQVATDSARVEAKINANATINLEETKQQTAANPAQQSSNDSTISTFVITPWKKFTNTFVNKYEVLVISYKDGNLYSRPFGHYQETTENKLMLKDVKDVYITTSSIGQNSHFAIKNDGSLWAWGDNQGGQLGDNTGISKTDPVKIMDNVKDVNLNGPFFFAVKNDGTVYAWGGTNGIGNANTKYAPEKLPINNWQDVLAAKDDIGYKPITINSSNQLGQNGNDASKLVSKYNYNISFTENSYVTGKSSVWTLMPNGNLYRDSSLFASNVAYAAQGYTSSYCYITKDGDLYAWGINPVGDGSNIPRKDPVLVLQNVKQCDPAWHYALTVSGDLYAVDIKNNFKYKKFASNVYLIGDERSYYTNDGSFYVYNRLSNNFDQYKDVALPKLKYEIKPQ